MIVVLRESVWNAHDGESSGRGGTLSVSTARFASATAIAGTQGSVTVATSTGRRSAQTAVSFAHSQQQEKLLLSKIDVQQEEHAQLKGGEYVIGQAV